MSLESALFSHQREIAIELSRHFDQTIVVTSDPRIDSVPQGLTAFSTNWAEGETFRNVLRFYLVTLPIIFKHRKDSIVFSHMVDVQAFLIAGFCKLLSIRHYLWYAHKSKSLFLRLSAPFLDKIFTSTRGSCPLNIAKVFPIGQAVRIDNGAHPLRKAGNPPISWYHIGRLDPSKKIEDIIFVMQQLHNRFPNVELHIYGVASSESTQSYAKDLVRQFSTPYYKRWLTFHGELNHALLEEVSMRHDGFIHAFQGSLDKTLIEAALLKRIIVSANPEFCAEFEAVNQNSDTEVRTHLQLKLQEIYNSPSQFQQQLIERNYSIASSRHTMEVWVKKLISGFEIAEL
jgi:glycosyltransferase involved in cell wall biosynthesis